MRIAFRADASVQIGIGHVMRCLTLADELTRQGHECWFICRDHPGHLGDLIISKDHGLTLLPARTGENPQLKNGSSDNYAEWLGVRWENDASQTLNAIRPLKPDWLIVDHYALDAEWERTLVKEVGQIMVIDDLANRPHDCVLLLDQNLGRATSDYDGLMSDSCRLLIGPHYALLRPEFAALRRQSLKRRENPELKRILISLGGVDRTNVTGQVLNALAKSPLPTSTELDIIMGEAAPSLNEVRQQAVRLPFKTTVSVNVQDMAERMCMADLSIGAAGGTAWERCCLGLPAVLVILADNQLAGAKALEVSGAAIAISDAEQVEVMLPSALAGLGSTNRLKRMSDAAANITDGNGIFSVAQAMSAVSGRA